MKLNVVRTTTVAVFLFGLFSGPLLAKNIHEILHNHKIENGTQVFLSNILKQPETRELARTLIKEFLTEGRDIIEEIKMTVKEITQLIKEGGPVADKIIEKIASEQRKNEVAKAEIRLKQEAIRLKIEKEKQETIRKKAQLNYQKDSSYTGLIMRGLKTVVWPAAFTCCFVILKSGKLQKSKEK